jgi:hypothetical protein
MTELVIELKPPVTLAPVPPTTPKPPRLGPAAIRVAAAPAATTVRALPPPFPVIGYFVPSGLVLIGGVMLLLPQYCPRR